MTENTITVAMARKKLGRRGEKMTDAEIDKLLQFLRFLCNKAIDSVVEKKESN
jgi:hypothetical protein